jgi:hypothetical protein
MKRVISFFILTVMTAVPAIAQTPAPAADSALIEACRATGLIALKEVSPSVKDIVLDMDSLTVAKANTKVENTPIRAIVLGEVYLERKEVGKAQHFLCLIGEKGKVLLTFLLLNKVTPGRNAPG